MLIIKPLSTFTSEARAVLFGTWTGGGEDP